MFYWAWTLFHRCYRAWANTVFTQDESDHRVPNHKLPWLYIGAVVDDQTISVTDTVNNRVRWGDCVTQSYLDKITQIDAYRWIYLDAKTLEEKDFPSDGLLIEEDDTKQSSSN